jgi:CRISPR/Cas system-associated exonuclease Cas4 (RecB family)
MVTVSQSNGYVLHTHGYNVSIEFMEELPVDGGEHSTPS